MLVAFDTETDLIRPGARAPELACMTWRVDYGPAEFCRAHEAPDVLRGLADRGARFLGQNVAYDFAVLLAHDPSLTPLVFRLYEDDRIEDLMIREQLLDIASGEFQGREVYGEWRKHGYSLDDIHAHYTGRRLEKDLFRLQYGIYRWFPTEQWPAGAIEYAKKDAYVLRGLYDAQAERPHQQTLRNAPLQGRAALCFALMGAWGVRTSEELVEALRHNVEHERARVGGLLHEAGLVKADGSRSTKAAMARMRAALLAREWPDGRKPRLTKKGAELWEGLGELSTKAKIEAMTEGFQLDEDACLLADDEVLGLYATYSKLTKVLSNDIELLLSGEHMPIHGSFGLVISGRSNSFNPNLQNLSNMKGIRECFVPRPGCHFADADFEQLELFCLGEVCQHHFGHSGLLNVLNAGRDPHTELGAMLARMPVEEAYAVAKDKEHPFAKFRAMAKPGNFGIPGGMGKPKFKSYAANKPYRVHLTDEEIDTIYESHRALFPEVKQLQRMTGQIIGTGGGHIEQLYSGRLRWCAEDEYTAACNTWFQGLGADATKNALWRVTRAAYARPEHVLYGIRPIFYVHDQVVAEVKAAEQAEAMAAEMREGADAFFRHTRTRAEPCLMDVWSKKAETTRDANGRLIPWRPKAA